MSENAGCSLIGKVSDFQSENAVRTRHPAQILNKNNMNDGPKEGYAFVIDTDSYAGNFEREMCAYLTGIIGDCEVGDNFVEELPINFEDTIKQVSDDMGTYRPCSIWIEPITGEYNSVAIFFHKEPVYKDVEFLKNRIKLFNNVFKEKSWKDCEKDINILGLRLIHFIFKTEETKIE